MDGMNAYSQKGFLDGNFENLLDSQDLFGSSYSEEDKKFTPSESEADNDIEKLMGDNGVNSSFEEFSPSIPSCLAALKSDSETFPDTGLDLQNVNIQLMEDTSNAQVNFLPKPRITLPLLEETPTLDEWPGPFNFKVVPNCPTSIKDQTGKRFFYPDLNKLYCDSGLPVEFKIVLDYFKLSPEHLSQYCIQVSLAFDDPKLIGEAVRRCQRHAQAETKTINSSNVEELMRVSHMIRSTDLGVSNQPTYYQAVGTSRCYVINAMTSPNVGTECVKRNYSFTCLNSCLRPLGTCAPSLSAIFCLIDGSGKLVGRSVLKLRVCSAPKRDFLKDQKRHNSETKDVVKPEEVKLIVDRGAFLVARAGEEETSSSQETIYSDYEGPKRIKLSTVFKQTRDTLKLRKNINADDTYMHLLIGQSWQLLKMLDDINEQAKAWKNTNPGPSKPSPDRGFHEH